MLQHKGTVELFAPGLRLRRFTLEDAPAMYANWASDPLVTRYVTWETHASVETTRSVLAEWVPQYEKQDYYHWLIEYEGVPIGSISLFGISDWHRRGELGYCIGSSYWNKGITTKAVSLVLDFAFQEVGLERVIARHDVENPASGRVMQKAGMIKEGVLRRDVRRKSDGVFTDMVIYGILRDEWAARRQNG